jgi:molybdopterin molybdotransferase
MRNTNLAVDCSAGDTPMPVDDAFAFIVGEARHVEDCEQVPLETAVGRITSREARTLIPLPPFDHSAIDGFGLSSADLNQPPPHRLRVIGQVAAGGAAELRAGPGEAIRMFTGAAVPPGVAAVVLEERCSLAGGWVRLNVAVPAAANIRRQGEDVIAGSAILEAGTMLDARHVAILAAAGLSEIEVRRRIRLVALSTGDELRPVGHPLDPGSIYDSNRSMLGALLTRPWIETLSTQHVNDQMDTLAETLRKFSLQADVIVTTGGAAGSDTDYTARAIVAAGGQASSLRLALRPGKPVVFGKINRTLVLGLPGNPVAAMVNFLLFGRALVLACAGLTVERPRGQAALTAGPISHSPGRTELVPARIVGFAKDGRPLIEKLGRGGSARLRPLVLADGLAEIPGDIGDVGVGAPVSFHAFHAAFAP